MGGYILHTRTDDILDQGKDEAKKEIAIRMNHNGFSVDVIAQCVGEELETIKSWIAPTPATA